MTLFVGVDPDTVAPGYGIIRDGKILDCGVISVVDEDMNMEGRLVVLAKEAARQLYMTIGSHRQVHEPVKIAVESQYFANAALGPDLLNLARVAGMLAGVAGMFLFDNVDLYLPRPSDWKGTIKKKQHQALLVERMSLEGLLSNFPAKYQSEMIDGIGLAEWLWKGRMVSRALTKPKARPKSPYKRKVKPRVLLTTDWDPPGD